jgi:O-antigen biosynthesis protein
VQPTDDRQSINALRDFAGAELPRLLFVSHALGGGVEEHVALLSKLVATRARVMVLRPIDAHRVLLELPGQLRIEVVRNPWSALVAALHALDFSRIHVHHIQGLPQAILDIDVALRLPLDFTLHDYVSICPQNQLVDSQGRYCGEPDTEACNRCIAERPNPWQKDIVQWRADFEPFLQRAARVFAPSASVAEKMAGYFPNVVITHLAPPEPVLPAPRVVKVALLGSLSRAKGLAAAIDVATLAQRLNSPVQLCLIGHAAEPFPTTLPFVATGSYEADQLPDLIANERPDVIWLPSQVPETFSYTLTAAIDSGIPVVASNIGALAERLRLHANASLVAPTACASTWHAALLNAAEHSPQWRGVGDTPADAARRSQRAEHATDYVERYLHDLPGAGEAAAPEPLIELHEIARSASAPSAATGFDLMDTPQPSILSAFRIGIYGGHRPSVELVERALETLPSNEAHVVARSHYEALSDEVNSAHLALAAERKALATSVEQTLAQQHALDDADQRAAAARAHIAHLEATVQQQQTQLAALKAEYDALHASLSLRVTRPLRSLAQAARRARHIAKATVALIPRIPALSGRAMERYRRGGWRGLRDRVLLEFQPVAATKTVVLPSATLAPVSALTLKTTAIDPVVSILIPVYGHHETTFACLKSIQAHPTRRTFEVIVMDDCSIEPAALALSEIAGIRVIRNERNFGFIGNVNAAAAQAVGHWLVILNNDTVLREGALDGLLDTFEAHQNVGLVGSKLLNMNGSVQEAGGIVWRDGSAWNWGRGFDREDPRVNYVRDADYCSGAALAIKRDLFAQLGGFDPHYAPAYYEDTDLAFRVRETGLRVLYQPAAEIFHREGVSHGRDDTTGVKAYQAANAKKFYGRWQQTLLTHRENAAQPELEMYRARRSNILIVEACMITPDQDSGSVRMFNLMRILLSDGHHVSFIADNLDGDSHYAAKLTAMGVEVLHGRFAGSVKNVLRQRGPSLDTIVFCRYYIATQYVAMVRSVAPRARIVFDTVDLHFLREEREAALVGDAALHRSAAATRSKELAVMARSDVTVVVSAAEKALLAKQAPTVRVEIISNITPSIGGSTEANAENFDARQGILFIGGFRHPPNVDAIKWYVADVLPLLRDLLPGVTTTIVGSHMPPDVTALASEGLAILGFVPDADPLLRRARVSIAPLRYGSGVKGKINEAMNYGIPVVATSLAVEAMNLQDGLNVLVANTVLEFAQAIVRLHTDSTLWSQLANAGRINVQTHFSAASARAGIDAVFGIDSGELQH